MTDSQAGSESELLPAGGGAGLPGSRGEQPAWSACPALALAEERDASGQGRCQLCETARQRAACHGRGLAPLPVGLRLGSSFLVSLLAI